jgi:hypothetical protein
MSDALTTFPGAVELDPLSDFESLLEDDKVGELTKGPPAPVSEPLRQESSPSEGGGWNPLVYGRRVTQLFGWRFVAFLAVSQFVLKGMTRVVGGSILLPVYKNVFGLDAATLQFYTMLIMTPWALKPLLGLLSDLVRCGGYHKRWWLIQSLVLGCVGAGLSLLAFTQRAPLGLALCFAAVSLQVSMYDLMSEAHYSAVTRDNPKSGADIVTAAQGLQMAGALAAMSFVGILSDHEAFVPLLVVMFGLLLVPVVPTLLGWLPEERAAAGRCLPELVGREQLRRDRWMILVVALTGLAAPATSALANLGPSGGAGPIWALALSLVFTALSLTGAWLAFPPMLARVATFRVLSTLARPSIGAAMDYFYVAGPECLPGGPHFSYVYYVTIAGIIGSFTALLGVLVYQQWLSGFRFRAVVMLTSLLRSLIGASDLILVLRLNVALGIPDSWAYLVGEAIMEPLISMLDYIPDSALLSKVVPVGMEGSAYAFMAGLSNFAWMISELSGALIFDMAGVRTVVPCDFAALPWLVLACHVAIPAVVALPAAWFLIPNVGQREEL